MPKTYEPIQTQTVGTAVAAVTFSSIPQTYTDLIVIADADLTSGGHDLRLRFNADSGTNYSRTILYGNGTSPLATRNNSTNNIISAAFGGTNSGSYTTINVMNYSNSTTNKTTLQRGGYTGSIDSLTVGLWRNTAAITEIECGNTGATTWVVGSTFTLYGIKAA
jgi:hypothetical protein